MKGQSTRRSMLCKPKGTILKNLVNPVSRNNSDLAASNCSMISTVHVSEIFELVVVFVGVIALLKRVAEMDGYHKVRVIALTLILSLVPILLFVGYALEVGRSGFYQCTPRPDWPVQ